MTERKPVNGSMKIENGVRYVYTPKGWKKTTRHEGEPSFDRKRGEA